MAAAMALMVGGTAGAATDRYREALKQVLFMGHRTKRI